MKNFTYVYVLQSKADPDRHYTGMTDDLHDRIRRHNAGEVSHTAKFAPWNIRVAVAFADRERAAAFEAYLKSHSGRVFSSRHF
ncbi:MAG TPA: GIY-YIG nuclease family protein [Kiritimatiellia bacterium]|nr:GIY-YIG nuclease family protein [Kiritimatiellia bacterium]